MFNTEPKQVGAAKFKESCLEQFNQLPPEGIIVAKHGRPVARVLPYDTSSATLIGSMAGRIAIRGDLLTTGELWEAAADDQP